MYCFVLSAKHFSQYNIDNTYGTANIISVFTGQTKLYQSKNKRNMKIQDSGAAPTASHKQHVTSVNISATTGGNSL